MAKWSVMGSTPSRTQVKSIKPSKPSVFTTPLAAPKATSEAWAHGHLHERVAALEEQLSECEAKCREAGKRAETSENQVRSFFCF